MIKLFPRSNLSQSYRLFGGSQNKCFTIFYGKIKCIKLISNNLSISEFTIKCIIYYQRYMLYYTVDRSSLPAKLTKYCLE